MPGPVPFALILDNRYQQEWDLSTTPHRLRVWGGDFRLRVITGDTMADVRRVVWSWLEGEARKISSTGWRFLFERTDSGARFVPPAFEKSITIQLIS